MIHVDFSEMFMPYDRASQIILQGLSHSKRIIAAHIGVEAKFDDDLEKLKQRVPRTYKKLPGWQEIFEAAEEPIEFPDFTKPLKRTFTKSTSKSS